MYTKWGFRWLAIALVSMLITGAQCDLGKKIVVGGILVAVMIPPISILFPSVPLFLGVSHIVSLLMWAGGKDHLYRCNLIEWSSPSEGLITPSVFEALKVTSKSCFSRWCV